MALKAEPVSQVTGSDPAAVRAVNNFNGNYQQAEMVKAFLSSTEYRARFGQQ